MAIPGPSPEPAAGRFWVIPLTHRTPPLSLNSRMHWARKKEITEELRGLGITYARKLKIPRLERFTAELHYAPTRNGTRDSENLTPIAKPIVDGIGDVTKALDSHEHYRQLPPVIEPATGRPGRLWLVLREERG